MHVVIMSYYMYNFTYVIEMREKVKTSHHKSAERSAAVRGIRPICRPLEIYKTFNDN
jgi:hypothetical protein